MATQDIIRADFDRIALLATEGWNHNSHYHQFLLHQIPAECHTALEIGCGTGEFSRLLAKRSRQVLALDLSPQMIRIASEKSKQFSNIDFQVADVTRLEVPAQRFDCIVAIATLHHLPMTETLLRLKDLLNAKGRLLILDLFQADLVSNVLFNTIAIPLSVSLRLLREGRLRPTREVRDAWREHERHDSLLTIGEVRQTCQSILPGAVVRRHLLWRYSIVWTKRA